MKPKRKLYNGEPIPAIKRPPPEPPRELSELTKGKLLMAAVLREQGT